MRGMYLQIYLSCWMLAVRTTFISQNHVQNPGDLLHKNYLQGLVCELESDRLSTDIVSRWSTSLPTPWTQTWWELEYLLLFIALFTPQWQTTRLYWKILCVWSSKHLFRRFFRWADWDEVGRVNPLGPKTNRPVRKLELIVKMALVFWPEELGSLVESENIIATLLPQMICQHSPQNLKGVINLLSLVALHGYLIW